MRDIRILRPYQDERSGIVVPPGVIIRAPAPEAESLRLSSIGEVMETHPPRRERAVPAIPERR